jgi:regulator of sigma E protease
LSIVLGILIFSLIVLVHEAGHFVAARKCGVGVEEFALGMGPKLAGFHRGGTLYSLRLFPLGGFCKMVGEDAAEYGEDALNAKPVWKRMIVMAAGAFVNLIFAFLIFFLMAMFLTTMTDLTVDSLVPGYPAEAAGMRPGDKILRAEGTRLHIYEDLQFAFMNYEGQPLTFVVERDGRPVELTFPLRQNEGGAYIMGVALTRKTGFLQPPQEGLPRASLLDTAALGFWQIGFYIKASLYSIVQLVTLRFSIDEVSGPIGIVSMIGQVYDETVKTGIWMTVAAMLQMAGLLSASIGVFNLLPLPALDGGRLLFLLVELARGKPLEPEKEGMVHLVGFALLILLAVVVAFNDITRLVAGRPL